MTPTIGSLCTGIGGLDLAVEAHFGAEMAWYSEIEPSVLPVLARTYPNVPNLGDLKLIDWADVPPVDILTAGYPCQPFSHAGKRKGVDDPRHLWPWIAEGIHHLRPRVVVLENVRGHLSKGFDVVLGSLAQEGFDAEWCVLRASDVGAPHQRARVWIVAARHADSPPQDAHAEEGSPREAVGEPDRDVADTDRGRRSQQPQPHGEQDAWGQPSLWDDPERLGVAAPLTLLPTPVVNDMGSGKTPEEWDEWTERMRAKHGNGNGHGKSLSIEVSRLLPTPTAWLGRRPIQAEGDPERWENKDRSRELSDCITHLERADVDWGIYEPAIRRWEAVLMRPAPVPKVNGRLSPRFVEWMQGYPEGWIAGLDDSKALTALGNAVVPLQAYAALCELVPALDCGVAA
jgi:DNA (cytosine-5)-methyltransferase 1